jgi:RNA polymerase sigma-70 factor (ECF subfamily)
MRADGRMRGANVVTAETDQQLVLLAQAGSGPAFERLMTRHYDRIHRMAWRWCGAQTAAEDVAQEVCIKIATALATFRADASFTTWLYRITYHAAVDHLRANQRTSPTEPSEIEKLADGAAVGTPEDAVIDAELWDEVRRLPPQQRDAVLLIYAEDMTHAEAAGVMGCTEKTVSWHLFEARKRLKSKLAAVG